MLQILLGLGAGYFIVTLAESFLHHHIHHATTRLRTWQKRYPRLLGALRSALRSHEGIHHLKTFRRSHVVQFDTAQQKRDVDASLADAEGQRIIAERYGVTLSARSVVLFVLPVLPILPLVAWFAPLVAFGMLPAYIAYPCMSRYVHPYLHMRYDDALAQASAPMRCFLRTAYARRVWRHHWLHHKHHLYNFNLLLGGDWLRGRVWHATPAEIAAMADAGIPLD